MKIERRDLNTMNRNEIIQMYLEQKHEKHLICDVRTGLVFEVTDKEWSKKMMDLINRNMTPIQKLALAMHSELCNEDGDNCSFLKEMTSVVDHDWNQPAHIMWISRARQVMDAVANRTNIDTVIDIFNAL